MNKSIKSLLAAAACMTLGYTAFAAVTVDDDAVGFVGKGDVQLVFLWNNAQLQACVNSTPQAAGDAGCLRFSYASVQTSSTTVESDWTCSHPTNGNTQERSRTVTTTTTNSRGGVAASLARVKNQVSGFNLNGGNLSVTSSAPVVTSEGPQLGSCPNHWTASAVTTTTVESAPVGTRTLTITDTRSNTSYTIDADTGAPI